MGGRGKKRKIEPGSERKIGPGVEPDGEPEVESQIGPDGERELDSEIKIGEESARR